MRKVNKKKHLTILKSYAQSTLLSKWSRRVRVRDNNTCYMCGQSRKKKKRGGVPLVLQAHHIYPKYLFPWKMFDLNNGITLCFRCHRMVLHFSYILKSWLRYCSMFRQYVRRKRIKQFNAKYDLYKEKRRDKKRQKRRSS